MRRRTFFNYGLLLVAGRAFAKPLKLVDFSDSGQRKGVIQVDKVQKSDAEWEKQLTPEQDEGARHGANGSTLYEMRGASRTRVRRWSQTNGPTLLHEFRGARFRQKLGQAYSFRAVHILKVFFRGSDPGDLK